MQPNLENACVNEKEQLGITLQISLDRITIFRNIAAKQPNTAIGFAKMVSNCAKLFNVANWQAWIPVK